MNNVALSNTILLILKESLIVLVQSERNTVFYVRNISETVDKAEFM